MNLVLVPFVFNNVQKRNNGFTILKRKFVEGIHYLTRKKMKNRIIWKHTRLKRIQKIMSGQFLFSSCWQMKFFDFEEKETINEIIFLQTAKILYSLIWFSNSFTLIALSLFRLLSSVIFLFGYYINSVFSFSLLHMYNSMKNCFIDTPDNRKKDKGQKGYQDYLYLIQQCSIIFHDKNIDLIL